MASFLRKLSKVLTPGVPSAALPGGKPKDLLTVEGQLEPFTKASVKEDVGFTRDVAPYALAAYGAVYGVPAAGISAGASGAYTGYAVGQSLKEGNPGGLVSLLDTNSWAGVIGQLGTAYLNYRAGSQSPVMPGGGMVQTMGALPPLARLGTAVGPAIAAGGAVVARSAASAMRGAVTWCRRNPAWCANIGGTAAVAAMIGSGQLPMPRRRRGRGISSRDLRSFRRVHNLLATFCAPKARIRKRTC